MPPKAARAHHKPSPAARLLNQDTMDLIASSVVESDPRVANIANLRASALGMGMVSKGFLGAYRQTSTPFDGTQKTAELPFLGNGREMVDCDPKQHFLLFYKGGVEYQEYAPEAEESDVGMAPVFFEPASLLVLRDMSTAGREVFVYLIQSTLCRFRLGGITNSRVCVAADQLDHYDAPIPEGMRACIACQLDTNETIRAFCCRDAFVRMFEAERFLAPEFAQKVVRQPWFNARDDNWLKLPINNCTSGHTLHAALHTTRIDAGSLAQSSEKVRRLSGCFGVIFDLGRHRSAWLNDDDLAVFSATFLTACGMRAPASELMLGGGQSAVYAVDAYPMPRGLVPKGADYSEKTRYVREIVGSQKAAGTSLVLFDAPKQRASAVTSRKRSAAAAALLNDTDAFGQMSTSHFTAELRSDQARSGLIDARFRQPGAACGGSSSDADEGDDPEDEDYTPKGHEHTAQAVGKQDDRGQGSNHNQVIPQLGGSDHLLPADYVSSDEEGVSVYHHGFSVHSKRK